MHLARNKCDGIHHKWADNVFNMLVKDKNFIKTTFNGSRRPDVVSETLPVDFRNMMKMWRSDGPEQHAGRCCSLTADNKMPKSVQYMDKNTIQYSKATQLPWICIAVVEQGMSVWGHTLRVSSTQGGNSLLLWVGSDTSVWHWKSGRDHYWGLESRPLALLPPLVNYWSSVTGAQCPRPVTVKDEGVLALSNEPSVEMPATNDPWAETHLSSARAMGAVGRLCVCVCVYAGGVYIWPDPLNTPPPLSCDPYFPLFLQGREALGLLRTFSCSLLTKM